MPPVVAAGAIAGAGVIGGAAISAGAAKKASKAQQNAAAAQIAATERNRDYQYDLNAPTIDAGENATGTIQGLLGIGGDPAASAAALNQFRSSNGYTDLLNTGLGAVNANAYARGLGNSGAAMKALLAKGSAIADSSQQGYIANLTNLASQGATARGLVAGIGNNSTNLINNATQGAADARGNAALTTGAAWSGALQGLANIGGAALGSSFASPAPTAMTSLPGYTGYNPAAYGGGLALPSQRGW